MQKLHAKRGIGYLAAFLQATPELREQAASGQRDVALAGAAQRLCEAAYDEALHSGSQASLRILQAALKEAMTSLPVEHEAVLRLNYELALLLEEDNQHELALQKWLWLLPRQARVPEQWGFGSCPRLSAAQCLTALGKHAEAAAMALAEYEARVAAHGEGTEQTADALRAVLQCNEQAQSLPPATLIPMIQQHLVHLRRANQDGMNDKQVWEYLNELHTLLQTQQPLDMSAVKAASREMMQLARKHAAANYVASSRPGENDLTTSKMATMEIMRLACKPPCDALLIYTWVSCDSLAVIAHMVHQTFRLHEIKQSAAVHRSRVSMLTMVYQLL